MTLSEQETRLLQLVADGHRLTEAALELGVSRTTAQALAASAAGKLGASNLTGAVAIALRGGLIQ